MTLGRNLLAGFASAGGTAIVVLATTPIFLHRLGLAAYGLIGLYASAQALFGLLDFGLAPTMNREVARSLDDAARLKARDLLHTLGFVYFGLAALVVLLALIGAPVAAQGWFRSPGLPPATVEGALALMGVAIAFRLPIALYTGALLGAERMARASAIELAMSLLANGGAALVLLFIAPTIQAFLLWQAFAALVHLALVRAAAWRALGPRIRAPKWDGESLRRVWRFSAGLAGTAAIAAVFLQADKVVLSRVVSLEALGRYTLASLMARSLYMLLTPVFGVTYPRLSALVAAGDTAKLVTFYRAGARILTAAVVALAAFVGVLAPQIVSLWTGDARLGAALQSTIGLLLLGTVCNGAMHFPYALQLASGRADLPLKINLCLFGLYAPALIWLSLSFGIVGAAAAWTALNLGYLLVGGQVTHRLLLREYDSAQFMRDFGEPLLIAGAVAGGGGWACSRLPAPAIVQVSCGAALALAGFFAACLSLRAAGTKGRGWPARVLTPMLEVLQ